MSSPFFLPKGFGAGPSLQRENSSFSGNSHSGGGGGGGFHHHHHAAASSSNPHAAAIDSLSLTAQSVGLTVEQLAAALSQSSNLKVLTASESGSDSQEELALSLYRTESLALYRRCMLLAGFEPSAIEEHSPEYLQFAFKAWQEEGKRIQDMMDAAAAEQAMPMAQQQQQQEAQQHALEQLQAKMQGKVVQAQAQALAFEQQQQNQQLLLRNHLQKQQQGLKSLLERSYGHQQHHHHQPHHPSYSDGLQQRLTEMQVLNSRSQFNTF